MKFFLIFLFFSVFLNQGLKAQDSDSTLDSTSDLESSLDATTDSITDPTATSTSTATTNSATETSDDSTLNSTLTEPTTGNAAENAMETAADATADDASDNTSNITTDSTENSINEPIVEVQPQGEPPEDVEAAPKLKRSFKAQTPSEARKDISAERIRAMPSEKYIQEIQTEVLPEKMVQTTLGALIEEGVRSSIPQEKNRYLKEYYDYNWENISNNYWFPTLKLKLESTNHRLVNHKGERPDHFGPTGSFGFEFDEFTLFNWGLPQIDFQSQKATYKRNLKILDENSRDLRLNIIAKYFNLYRTQSLLEAYREKLRQASFIYRLSKQKLSLKQISGQEFMESREEYLKASEEFYLAEKTFSDANYELSQLLSSESNTKFYLTEKLKFAPMLMKLEEAQKIGAMNNSNILNSKTALENAHRNLNKISKESLPLPKITMNLGAYKHYFGEINSGINSSETRYQVENANNHDVELKVGINATWTIFGDGGLLNSKNRAIAITQEKIIQKELEENTRNLELLIRAYFERIRSEESRVKALAERSTNQKRLIDHVIENYLSKRTEFVNLKNALNDLTDASVEYSNSLYNQLYYKVELAKLLGVDDFPGEKFENLAVSENQQSKEANSKSQKKGKK